MATNSQPSRPSLLKSPSSIEVIWLDPPPDGEATHLTLVYSKPDAARAMRGFPSAARYEERTELIHVWDLPNGERAWLVVHNEPVREELRVQLEATRSHIAVHGREALEQRLKDDETSDLRAAMFGEQSDGVRLCVEISLTRVVNV